MTLLLIQTKLSKRRMMRTMWNTWTKWEMLAEKTLMEILKWQKLTKKLHLMMNITKIGSIWTSSQRSFMKIKWSDLKRPIKNRVPSEKRKSKTTSMRFIMGAKTHSGGKLNRFPTIIQTLKEMHLSSLILIPRIKMHMRVKINQSWFHIKCNGINMIAFATTIISREINYPTMNQIFFKRLKKCDLFKIQLRKRTEH